MTHAGLVNPCHSLPTSLELSLTWYSLLIPHSTIHLTSSPPQLNFLQIGTPDQYVTQLSISLPLTLFMFTATQLSISLQSLAIQFKLLSDSVSPSHTSH